MLISADLDGLKRINDSFGHKEGDAAIVETARVLRPRARVSPVGPSCHHVRG
jgi:diguanylate cyclase (GGDEF)-like protein